MPTRFFADVVDIALNRGQHDLALGLGPGVGENGADDFKPGLHGPRRHQHFGNENPAVGELIADIVHGRDQGVIEDDYDSEYRYRGRPLPALQGLDDHDHVIYVGTFSKTLFPAVRLGYLIAPPDHIDAFAAGQSLLSQNVSALNQTVVARFLEEGAYLAHIRRMRSAYKERRDCLIENLDRRARGLLDCQPTDAGMHLVAWLNGRDDRSAAEAIWRAGIDCLPLSMYCDKRRVDDGLMLGFACAPEKDIPVNVETLVQALEAALEKPSRGIQVERT